MHQYGQAFYLLKNKLLSIYDDRESAAIAHELLLHITGLDKTQRLLQKEKEFTDQQQERFERSVEELIKGRPIQYIIGSSWFMGKEFKVNEHVLIPRPETEELVAWVTSDLGTVNTPIKILDIGTGSGCIAISLKLLIPHAEITAIDISSDALCVAKENAKRLNADIQFMQVDFLNIAERNKLGTYDVIVSNPPYIKASDKDSLHINVRNYEPELALFVPSDDRLLFYREIAIFGKTHLTRNGSIYCETETTHAMATNLLFKDIGYNGNTELRKDMHDNWRMVKAVTVQ